MLRSSYFKISSQENLDEEEDFTKDIQVYDEFSCALMCSSTVVCHFALFDKMPLINCLDYKLDDDYIQRFLGKLSPKEENQLIKVSGKC